MGETTYEAHNEKQVEADRIVLNTRKRSAV